MMSIRSLVFLCIVMFCAGCSHVPEPNDFAVRTLVEERISKPVRWYQGADVEPQINTLIQQLLQKELELETCVQIALFNNPSIQATFEALGMKQADLVQAGLFQNPLFQGFVRFPDHKSLHTNSEFSITQSFLEFFLIPLRKKFAETALRQAELNVAHAVLNVAFAVRELYHTLQADLHIFHLETLLIQEAHAAYLLAKGQFAVGNCNDLELQKRKGDYLEAILQLMQTKNKILEEQKQLAQALGLRANEKEIVILKKIGVPSPQKCTEEELFKKASKDRLDIISARLEINRIAEIGATKQWWAYTDVAIGVSGEKEPEGSFVLGPLISIDLPFFNHGQADRARLYAELKASKERLKALEIDLTQDVKAILKELKVNQQRLQAYAKMLLPLKRKELATSQRYYNVMGLNVYKLLEAKKEELDAEIAFINALRDYSLSRVKLDRIVGSEIR